MSVVTREPLTPFLSGRKRPTMRIMAFTLLVLVTLAAPALGQASVWYLLLPPMLPGAMSAWPAPEAPLDQWSVGSAFDTAEKCKESQLQTLMSWSNMAKPFAPGGDLEKLPKDHFMSGSLRQTAHGRCLPSEVISAPRRWFLLQPPAPLTVEAPASQWQIKAGYYFAADCERTVQRIRRIIEDHDADTEALKRPPGERSKEEDGERWKRFARSFDALATSKYTLFGPEADVPGGVVAVLEQARYARCVAREALPPGMLPLK
jgi:hypothetical protein